MGFRVRGYEIRLIVYRVAERDESRKSVKKTNAITFSRGMCVKSHLVVVRV